MTLVLNPQVQSIPIGNNHPPPLAAGWVIQLIRLGGKNFFQNLVVFWNMKIAADALASVALNISSKPPILGKGLDAFFCQAAAKSHGRSLFYGNTD
jgi:hypothetical protein